MARKFIHSFVIIVVLLQCSLLATADNECSEGDLLPHADNCQLFYKCSGGSLEVFTCPDGLHFNPAESQCDWPVEAKCAAVEDECSEGDLQPHADDCQLFYKCSGGILHVLPCPDGLHFNPVESQCDWPEEAKCGAVEDKCSEGDLQPHADDCQLFYKCSGGILHVLPCPDGLHFNPLENQCDWPEEAKCAAIEHECSEGDLRPHSDDCQLFYKCSSGSFEVLTCPDGLHFNPVKNLCDWPEDAKCALLGIE